MNYFKIAGGKMCSLTVGIFVVTFICFGLASCAQYSQYDPYMDGISKGDDQAGFGNNEEAAKFYDQSIKVNPKRALGYAKRGLAYANLKQYDKALADLDMAVKLDPKDANSLMTMGRYHLSMQHYPKAIDDFSQVIKLAPTAELYRLRADAYFQARDEKHALADLQKSADMYLAAGDKDKCNEATAMIKKCRGEQQ